MGICCCDWDSQAYDPSPLLSPSLSLFFLFIFSSSSPVFGGLYARASLGSGRVQAAVGWMKSCSGHAPGPGLHVVALPGGYGGRRTGFVDGAVAVVVVALARRFGPGVVLLGCAIAPSFLPLRPPFAFGLNLFVFRMVWCVSLRGSHPALCDDSERCGDICTSGFRDVCTAYCTLSQR